MSDIKTFYLPDLGEGLPDAEIVEWHIKTGDVIRLDEPLVSMETAKAVVEVPSPFSGRVIRRAGEAGDVILTGSALVEIELDAKLPQRADARIPGIIMPRPRLHRKHPRSKRFRSLTSLNQMRPMPAQWSAPWKAPTPSAPNWLLPSVA
jgi:pyruvate/2-oxoglutarate dehydrogenase complex dihydrolipoamide acyltransferase (E2) component